ncbi:hypothetical protein SAMN03159353_10629 [Cedecea sp. NFIX57]|nr:hypothetical protein SAMN03159353_10629 [Cedecea sp. NFIX57]
MKNITLDEHILSQMAAFLPESVRQMVDVLGGEATARLVNRFGGASFPVSRGLRDAGGQRLGMLLEVLTPDQLQRFMHTFGGDSSFLIPKCDQAKREWRNRLFIRDLRDALATGASRRMALSWLCPRYDIGSTQAWILIREYGLSGGGKHASVH